MLWIYNIGIIGYQLLLRIAALFNNKAKLFVDGRKNIFDTLRKKLSANDRPVWFHFASLGEFEQGRPVLENLKAKIPSQKVVVTFFSPSGYEIRKNYAFADVFYLPLDTAENAKKFVEIVNPQMAIFTKYEFWFHYFSALHEKQIPLYLISGIFRRDQIFFKNYGGFYRSILKFVTHFFVQNEESVQLLQHIGFGNVSLSGDTRFDRVYENAKAPRQLPEVESFCGDSPVFIGGSTWPADEGLIRDLAARNPDLKFIIAPHEVEIGHIDQIHNLFPKAIRFSELAKQSENAQAVNENQVLIIDNIGMLSSLYQYAQVAYIGGGFGVGIHNTLEAAAFGLPVIFGPKYHKFQEATDLIAIGAGKSIKTIEELVSAFEYFKDNEEASAAVKQYVEGKRGATAIILAHLDQ